jgi:hypothetical protein
MKVLQSKRMWSIVPVSATTRQMVAPRSLGEMACNKTVINVGGKMMLSPDSSNFDKEQRSTGSPEEAKETATPTKA